MKQFLHELFISGISGWVFFLLTAIIGGGGYMLIRRQKTVQRNIRTGGDVAGGSINAGTKSTKEQSEKIAGSTVQENITAKGDVAGGDINKDYK